MREHLYRAWLKKDNEMVEVKSIHLGTKKIMYGYSHGKQSYGNRVCSFNECELMEFTGLTDKNGKNIFENDIVIIDNEYVDEVIYSSGCFCMARQWFNYEFTYQRPECIEVIGNKYDNPELLKE